MAASTASCSAAGRRAPPRWPPSRPGTAMARAACCCRSAGDELAAAPAWPLSNCQRHGLRVVRPGEGHRQRVVAGDRARPARRARSGPTARSAAAPSGSHGEAAAPAARRRRVVDRRVDEGHFVVGRRQRQPQRPRGRCWPCRPGSPAALSVLANSLHRVDVGAGDQGPAGAAGGRQEARATPARGSSRQAARPVAAARSPPAAAMRTRRSGSRTAWTSGAGPGAGAAAPRALPNWPRTSGRRWPPPDGRLAKAYSKTASTVGHAEPGRLAGRRILRGVSACRQAATVARPPPASSPGKAAAPGDRPGPMAKASRAKRAAITRAASSSA